MAPGARSKFGAPMFKPKVFRKQIYCIEESICDIVRTFRRPGNCASFAPPASMGVGIIFPGGGQPNNSGYFQWVAKGIFQEGPTVMKLGKKNISITTPKSREKHFYTNKLLAK